MAKRRQSITVRPVNRRTIQPVRVLIKLMVKLKKVMQTYLSNFVIEMKFTWSAYPRLQSNRGPAIDRTKFMQVIVVFVPLGLKNLSLVATEIGKQAE